ETPRHRVSLPVSGSSASTSSRRERPSLSTGVSESRVPQRYDGPPPATIDPAREYTARIRTEHGDIEIRLRPDLAPASVNSFVFLAREGFYDGSTFHRVVPGFIAQGGD